MTTMPVRILVVDDEPSSLELLEMHLSERDFEVACAVDGKECLEKVLSFDPQIVILDVRLPDADGISLLKTIKEKGKDPYVIIVTAFHDMNTTIRAIKLGAFEYIPKPIDLADLENAIGRALELSRTRQRTDGLFIGVDRDPVRDEIIGKTREMKEIFKTVGMLSGNRVTVLIEGETGTGKELVARAIHSHGPHREQPFIAINCSAIVESLLESELFGHEKGAFTGAVSTKRGKFELAGRGTILLDEVGEIPFEVQAKLLRFLQEKEFQRVGGEKSFRSEARIIAATNRNLLHMVKEGGFREDLYYRLSVAAIRMPPLRERKEDIPLIMEHHLRKINVDLGKEIRQVEGDALRRMMEYPWPGNVRELENVLTRAAMYTRGRVILDTVVAPLLEKGDGPVPERGDRETGADRFSPETEKEKIVRILQDTQWHYGNACRSLGISRPTLNKKMNLYGISPKPRNYGKGR